MTKPEAIEAVKMLQADCDGWAKTVEGLNLKIEAFNVTITAQNKLIRKLQKELKEAKKEIVELKSQCSIEALGRREYRESLEAAQDTIRLARRALGV